MIEKQNEKEGAIIFIPAALGSLATCLSIIFFTNQPEWVSITAGIVVLVVIFTIGFIINIKRSPKLSDEEKAILAKVSVYDIKTYPPIKSLVDEGFQVKGIHAIKQ